MSEPRGGSLALKFIWLFAIGALLGFGLCGVNFGSGYGGDAKAEQMMTIGGNVFAVCVFGLLGSFLWWIVSSGKGR